MSTELNQKPIQEQLFQIVRRVATASIDPAFVRDQTELTLQRQNDPELYPIFSVDHTLSAGYPGLCLLFHELGAYEECEQWSLAAHRHLVYLHQLLKKENNKLSASLWTGITGLGFSALAISNNGQHYQGLISSLNQQVLTLLPTLVGQANSHLKQGVKVTDYDTVRGLTGIGRYLLFFHDDVKYQEALKNILAYLVRLTEPRQVGQYQVPGWYVPENQTKDMFPNGFFDMGLSHGIVGPLSLLARSLELGVTVSGQVEAIERIVHWIEEWTLQDEEGSYWPDIISFEEQVEQHRLRRQADSFGGSEQQKKPKAVNYSWCYGYPAIARVLWIAGRSLKNSGLQDRALSSFRRLITLEKGAFQSPTFCHGYAGLLQIVTRMYEDSQAAFFKDVQEELVLRILDMYNPDLNFGFHTVEGREHHTYLDVPGMLNGFVGIALALLSSVQPSSFEWDAAFLIQ